MRLPSRRKTFSRFIPGDLNVYFPDQSHVWFQSLESVPSHSISQTVFSVHTHRHTHPAQCLSRPPWEDNLTWGGIDCRSDPPRWTSSSRSTCQGLVRFLIGSFVWARRGGEKLLSCTAANDIKRDEGESLNPLVVSFCRWCDIFCGAVRLRGEDGRRSVIQERGPLPDYQQHVSAFVLTLTLCVCVCV